MRLHTFLATVALLFALPALAADTPRTPEPVSVCYEVRVLKVRAGFCERAGVKLAGDTVLTDDKLRALLEAAQDHRDTTVMQFPRVTIDDGESATVRAGERKEFVTGITPKWDGREFLLAPITTVAELGYTLTLSGRRSADHKFVNLRASLTHTTEGRSPVVIPVSGFSAPRVEGGYVGGPIAFAQDLQIPALKTEKVEKTAAVPTNGTIVLGSWKETVGSKHAENLPVLPVNDRAENLSRLLPPVKDKGESESEVVVLATVRTVSPHTAHEARARNTKVRPAGWFTK